MKELIYVFLGGGAGSVCRFFASMYWKHLALDPRFSDMHFPWPTFIVNVIGCLMISLFYQFSEKWGITPEMRLLLTTGFCGGFTTFSTFSYEGMTLIRSGFYSTYALYLLGSIFLGLIAAFLPTLFSQS